MLCLVIFAAGEVFMLLALYNKQYFIFFINAKVDTQEGLYSSMSKVMKSFICRGCLNPATSTGRTSVDISASAYLELVDKFCHLLRVDGDADAAVEARI